MSDMNMPLNEEALPAFDEGELVFGAAVAPVPEGTYAVKAKLGKRGSIQSGTPSAPTFTIHVMNEIRKALKVVDPKTGQRVAGDQLTDGDKLLKKSDGSTREIHDFIRISATNRVGASKAVQFLKYAGDADYNAVDQKTGKLKYGTASALAAAVVEALQSEPDEMKLNGRWRASAEVGVDEATGKKKYENVNGIAKFPRNADGSVSHIANIDGEQVAAQFEVQEYGELTARDVQ